MFAMMYNIYFIITGNITELLTSVSITGWFK